MRALRGGRTTRGAGAALRAYALHLAQDKSTTFAQNVDNFIACTLDSKETCPQVNNQPKYCNKNSSDKLSRTLAGYEIVKVFGPNIYVFIYLTKVFTYL